MWTINFFGYWIHGYCDRETVRLQGPELEQLGSAALEQLNTRISEARAKIARLEGP